jgi:macrodomain Ter protein organizer (MatP/YcbG family)
LRKIGSENAYECAQNAENSFGFEFLERYHKDGDEFLKHIVRVTGDETLVSFVNVETKEQPKQWMHTHSPNKLKKFKQTSARNSFVGQEKSADGGIHRTKGHNTIRSVLRNTKRKKLTA